MGQVVELGSVPNIDQAWECYCEYAHELARNPDRLHDRPFHEEFQRRYMRWAHLFRQAEKLV